jgi:hypothetical protein
MTPIQQPVGNGAVGLEGRVVVHAGTDWVDQAGGWCG